MDMLTTNVDHFDATNEEYHALPGVSNSRLSDFIADPALYYGRYIADPPLFPRDPATPSMQFGTNVHAVIQAGSLDAVFTVIPAGVLNDQGHRKGKAWTQFAEENAGKTLVKAEEVEAYSHILRNVKAHPKAAAILYGDDGHNEFNIRWTDSETGLLMRARLDRARPSVLLADIKTTAAIDARRFSQTIFSYGYHRQDAIYTEAWKELTGDELPFAFVAVGNAPPYSVAVYTLDEAYLEMGRQEVRAALNDLRRRMDENDWVRTPEVVELSPPGYAKFQDAWEVTV